MKQTIWYCDENETIFPDEETAREGYKKWIQYLRDNLDEDEFNEVIFHMCFREITFEDYNRLHGD